ncbi:PD40 domain-containing protein [Pseudoalteromonas sp. MMG013]|uniref:TolB family protein n=1 Tax=Pseudoalteromonas sp. MMG013 TaxID=2822687 RepID=UPI001B366116|nr:DUF5050 domain-containing protein [Pseudoalteromonas sp. MMG013]MBQ4861037.1 PD40 domain-containing protein [Pseudoalteromonas sp. MMG013]
MSSKKISGIKCLLFSICFLSVTTGCQTNQKATSQPYSIIYGFKEGDNKSIYLSDEQGKRRIKIIDVPNNAGGYPAVSPTGKQIAFYGKYDKRKTWSIHTADIDGTNMRRLTNLKNAWDYGPAFSSDGKTIVFGREYTDKNGDMQEGIWLMDSDGTEQHQIKGLAGGAPDFMPDGRLLFHSKGRFSKTAAAQISIANIDGSNVIQLTNDDTDNFNPKISPDGTQIAYLSNRDGNQEVYVMNVDGSNQTRLTRNRIRDGDPAWSPDGSKVFFTSQNVFGIYDIYKVDKDGSSTERVLINASQTATVFHVDKHYLERLTRATQ